MQGILCSIVKLACVSSWGFPDFQVESPRTGGSVWVRRHPGERTPRAFDCASKRPNPSDRWWLTYAVAGRGALVRVSRRCPHCPAVRSSCRHLGSLAGGRCLVLAGDKGYVREEEMSGQRDPHIAYHGSLSCMVRRDIRRASGQGGVSPEGLCPRGGRAARGVSCRLGQAGGGHTDWVHGRTSASPPHGGEKLKSCTPWASTPPL